MPYMLGIIPCLFDSVLEEGESDLDSDEAGDNALTLHSASLDAANMDESSAPRLKMWCATPHAWPPNKIAAILARRRDAVVQEDIQNPCLSILPAQRSARFVSVSDEFVPVGRDPSKWLEVLHIGLSS